ncbi:MAG: type II toxin-antitoxin system VapC family toxin [Limisphaerales bacterium]
MNAETSKAGKTIWAFDLGKGSIGEAVRQGTTFLHKAFLRGPEDEPRNKMQLALMKEMLASGGISPFTEVEADFAAYLFCQIGRPKNADYKLRMDCLIAACAITAQAQLATDNECDCCRNWAYTTCRATVPTRWCMT